MWPHYQEVWERLKSRVCRPLQTMILHYKGWWKGIDLCLSEFLPPQVHEANISLFSFRCSSSSSWTSSTPLSFIFNAINISGWLHGNCLFHRWFYFENLSSFPSHLFFCSKLETMKPQNIWDFEIKVTILRKMVVIFWECFNISSFNSKVRKYQRLKWHYSVIMLFRNLNVLWIFVKSQYFKVNIRINWE